jgi:hypothetical protein
MLLLMQATAGFEARAMRSELTEQERQLAQQG